MSWPHAADTVLLERKHNKVPYSLIAKEINETFDTHYSKGAISARIKKLGLAKHRPIRKKEVMPAARHDSVPVETRPLPSATMKSAGATPLTVVHKILDYPDPCVSDPDIMVIGAPAVTFFPCDPAKIGTYRITELEPGQCRYPFGEGPFTFCGAPQCGEETSYCAEHHAVTRRVPA